MLLTTLMSGAVAAAPLLTNEVSAGVGVLGTGFTVARGVRLGDAHLTPTITARGLLGGFVIDGGLFTASPLSDGRTAFALNGALRLGYSGARWSVLGGVAAQVAPDARPAWRFLPTLRGSVSFGAVGLSLGVFDHLGTVPAHLSLDVHAWETARFSVGWVAPLGLIASGDLPIGRGFGLRLTAFAFRIANTESAQVLLSGTFGGAR